MKNLSKVCKVCKRPFNWRKKWKLNWEDVKYCSKRCYGSRSRTSVLSDFQL
ncbi:DUF2256 domain-containing protein [bacterium]|nr:DUF2256 domain-containing protein [bacterium]MBT4250590.1 DUF2256 domain-containing protein [bacterium]MBT4928255.1 DUF2256 domain-containing protein [bacterium]MBT6017629.1 DUF2256 domain-containing protein [bacterium]